MMDVFEFSKQFRSQLGAEMLNKHRIYLDTKYWISMRKASMGNASDTQAAIYHKLKHLVESNVVICPFSYHVYLELMKHGSEERRLQTASVVDELSKQITFISPLDIHGQELTCFIRNLQNKAEGKPLYNSTQYVWTKVAFFLGEQPPFSHNDMLTETQIKDIQIKFFKHQTTLTLVQMLKNKKKLPTWDISEFINSLNQGKDQNQDWKTFDDIYLQEIYGILDILIVNIMKRCEFLFPEYFEKAPDEDMVELSKCVDRVLEQISRSIQKKQIINEFPHIHIQAAINALFRKNKGQRYKENDLIDIFNAAWAMPYCDAFFTEKKLTSWICDKPLALHESYGTQVISNEDKVLAYLNKLTN